MIRTLVVEDERLVADGHCTYVRKVGGFTVAGVAHCGAQALHLASGNDVDLVLLDFSLPDMHGLDVCAALRTRARTPLDVIAVTSARDIAIVQQAISYGVVQYLIKPFGFPAFREKLHRYAEYRQSLLSTSGTAAQQDVDRLFATLRGSATEPLPKGLSRDSWTAVAQALRDTTTPLSSTEAARRAGLSRVTARRYLEHLTTQGLVARTLRYGTSGRPEQLYRWIGPAAG